MALFDLPGPIFAWLDSQAAEVASPGLRLVLWGVTAAMLSMLMYHLISAQDRIRHGRVELAEARRQLAEHDGEWEEAQAKLRGMLRAALAQVGRVSWPSIVASLPLLSLLAWLSSAYGYAYPAPGDTPMIRTDPPGLRTQWIPAAPGTAGKRCAQSDARGGCPHIVVFDGERRIAEVTLSAPVPVIHQRRWWNTLLANPAGYLPAGVPIDSISVDLPAREYLSFGPRWSRWWGTLFFVPLVLVSLALKRGLRIA